MTQSLVQNLRRSAEQFPDRCAIESGELRINYGSLWRRVCAAGAFLKRRGVGPGDRIAIAMQSGINFVISYYAAQLAGGVAVPLSTAAKSRELAAWLEHSEAKWIFGDAGNAELRAAVVGLAAPPVLVLSGEPCGSAPSLEEISSASDEQEIEMPSYGDRPAAIIYTSGTTGKPKGVLLSHNNVGSNAESIVEYLRLTSEDSIVTVLPFYYSYGSSVLHSHIKAGARLIIEQNFVYPHSIVAALANTRSTGFAGVPSTFALMLSRVRLDQFDLSGLRYVTQAGGAMSRALTESLRAALPGVDVVVMYGQTEATARLTYLPPADLSRKMGSVGIPIQGVRLEIRNSEGQMVPTGEVGDIWAIGPNVMTGYWRDEEATRAVLSDGWLKTGDMGYLDSEGYLYISGRRSDIIKVGAHRVHPREVEEVVEEIEGVQESVAIGIEDAMLGQVIKLFVVTKSGADLLASEIQSHCRERLASHKVPRVLEFVGSLPKTASGKILRAQLEKGV